MVTQLLFRGSLVANKERFLGATGGALIWCIRPGEHLVRRRGGRKSRGWKIRGRHEHEEPSNREIILGRLQLLWQLQPSSSLTIWLTTFLPSSSAPLTPLAYTSSLSSLYALGGWKIKYTCSIYYFDTHTSYLGFKKKLIWFYLFLIFYSYVYFL